MDSDTLVISKAQIILCPKGEKEFSDFEKYTDTIIFQTGAFVNE